MYCTLFIFYACIYIKLGDASDLFSTSLACYMINLSRAQECCMSFITKPITIATPNGGLKAYTQWRV